MRSNQAFCPRHPSPPPLVLSRENAEENSFVSVFFAPRFGKGGEAVMEVYGHWLEHVRSVSHRFLGRFFIPFGEGFGAVT